MFRPRIIPVLLLKNKALVKSKAFKNYYYIGDPINAVKIFNDLKAYKLFFLDIMATAEKRTIPLKFIEEVGEEANMPFAVGGGIKTLNDIQKIINAGAERVVINSYAVENPDFIHEASQTVGSSTIIVCIDFKKKLLGNMVTRTASGKKASGYSPLDFALLMEEKGAGEIMLQSIDRDGMMEGYDIELTKKIADSLKIPLVALGGAGNINHLTLGHSESHASELAAGSRFVYQGPNKGVLVNYPEKSELQFKNNR